VGAARAPRDEGGVTPDTGPESDRPSRSPRRHAARRSGGRRRAGRAELLLQLTNRIASLQTLDDQLKALVEMMVSATGAERGSFFLNDPQTGELHARVAQGHLTHEIRILNTKGIAGRVYTTGTGMVSNDAYASEYFDRTTDERTGFVTKSIVCAPIRAIEGEIIGVTQALNKRDGQFSQDDLELLEALNQQASIFLQSTLFREKMARSRAQESEFLDVVSEVSSEIQLGPLLQKIMETVTRMLNSERSTLFLNDDKTHELYTEIGQGLGATKIRLPNHVGIAGAVFSTGKTINIPYAYADLRFSPAFDKQTGFFTRSVLCVPVVNKNGKTIGVTQVLNKRGGPFVEEDEARLKAFTAQISIGLENAKLFDDVQTIKNYNESMLESMSNGVVTFDRDGRIVTCNAAGLRIFLAARDDVVGKAADQFFAGPNAWILEQLERVEETQANAVTMDAEMEFGGQTRSVNATIVPLKSNRAEKLGSMLLIEDISSEKRVKATMSRYMDPSLADKLLGENEEILGGHSSVATVLFSDVRNFTTLAEELGAQGTVALLNEYFTIMVDCIQRQGGMLDKFIGDAIMAVFGTPLAHEDDEDRAVRAAISMITELSVYNQTRAAHGKKPIDMGIGLNTDTVVSGNIGSPKRMDYTVIGDGVNLASRLEGACKQYGARILISDNTFKRLRGTYRTREVDRVVVKGKTEPVAIYEVLDYYTEKTFPNLREVLGHFKDGLNLYREGRWNAATASFRQALEGNPGDALAAMYIERCAELQRDPPAEWNGVWVLRSK
jgi:adenylate cyclase